MSFPSLPNSTNHKPNIIAKHSLKNDKLRFERWSFSAGEFDTPANSQNILVFSLNQTKRRHLIRLNGQEYDGIWQKNHFSLVPAGVSLFCAWEYTSEKLVFFIDPIFIKQIARETELVNPDIIQLNPINPQYDPQLEKIAKLFELELVSKKNSTVIGDSLYLDSLANILGIHLLRNYAKLPGKTTTINKYTQGLSSSKLQRAIAYIQDNLEQDISLEAIATHLNMSQYHFSRWFKQSMGIPPYQYVIQQRLELAKILLKHPNTTIAEIALECGFNSQSHLIHHFKKQMGITPKQYQQL